MRLEAHEFLVESYLLKKAKNKTRVTFSELINEFGLKPDELSKILSKINITDMVKGVPFLSATVVQSSNQLPKTWLLKHLEAIMAFDKDNPNLSRQEQEMISYREDNYNKLFAKIKTEASPNTPSEEELDVYARNEMIKKIHRQAVDYYSERFNYNQKIPNILTGFDEKKALYCFRQGFYYFFRNGVFNTIKLSSSMDFDNLTYRIDPETEYVCYVETSIRNYKKYNKIVFEKLFQYIDSRYSGFLVNLDYSDDVYEV